MQSCSACVKEALDKANTGCHKVYARESEELSGTSCVELCDVTIVIGGFSICVQLYSSVMITVKGAAAIASTQV